jgi:hypothetical protein
MSVRKGIFLLLALSALVFLVACGGSSIVKVVPPPSGGFTNSNLNGTYVFSTTGVDFNGVFLTIVGDFVANGSGTISSGALDLVSADTSVGVFPNQTITSSTYSITPDGRGQAILNTANGPVTLDFALQSGTHGLVTEFDTLGTGSGTIDAMPATVAQTALSNLTFGLSGTGAGPSYISFATIGSLTVDPNGLVTAGAEDFNNGGTPTTNTAITPTTSFVTVGTGTAPGTAKLITSVGTFTYDVYAVDSTHLKFVETDGSFFTSGDAYVPATAIPTQTLAYTMAGFDTSGFPIAMGGFLPVSSSATIVAGVEDFNDGGTLGTGTSVGGSFSALAGGRSVLQVTGFVNGANGATGTYNFAAYPFVSNGITGIQLLDIDTGLVTSGVAYAQSATSVVASQGYALNLSALNFGGTSIFEEDDTAEFTTTSSGFTGVVDLNDESSLAFKQALSGTYSVDGTGRGTAAAPNFFNFNFYVVNSSTALLLETDQTQVGTGVFELQGNGASPGAIKAPGSLLRAPVSPHLARHAAK